MHAPRYRPSFALRCAIPLVMVGVLTVTLAILGVPWTPAIVIGVVGSVILEPIAWLIEHRLVARAARRGDVGGSLWLVDRDAERREAERAFLEDTEDNPTLR